MKTIKEYKMLPTPKGSAFDRRKVWFRLHWRIREFLYGVKNIVRWMPTLYRDRDWDGNYIYMILQKKIEHQRRHLVGANRHEGIERDNFWMTVALNLLERVKEDYYEMEPYSDVYVKHYDWKKKDPFEKIFEVEWENRGLYLSLYRRDFERAKKKFPITEETALSTKAMYTAMIRHEKANSLLFRILKEKIPYWWD